MYDPHQDPFYPVIEKAHEVLKLLLPLIQRERARERETPNFKPDPFLEDLFQRFSNLFEELKRKTQFEDKDDVDYFILSISDRLYPIVCIKEELEERTKKSSPDDYYLKILSCSCFLMELAVLSFLDQKGVM